MIRSFIVFIILILMALPVLSQDQQDRILKKEKDSYLKKIRSEPENLDLHRELVETYKRKGLISISVSIYEDSAKRNPDNPVVMYVLGYAYLMQGSLQKAEEKLKAAIELKPDFPDAITALGDYYMKSGQVDLAVMRWREAIKADESFAPAYLSIARFHRINRDYQKALDEYDKAITVKTNRAGDVYFEMGLTYLAMQNLEEAESAFVRARVNSPKNGMVYYKLGQIYAMRGNRDKAVDFYRQGRKRDPDNSEAAYELAHIFLETNDTKYALLSFERGMASEGAAPEVTKELVKHIEKGTSQAASYLEKLAASNYSSNFNFLYFLGKLYIKLNSDELALKYLESAEKVSPLNADVHYQIGLLYDKLYPKKAEISQTKEPERDSQEQYRRAVDLGASEAELLFKVAQGYLEEGQEAKFMEVAEKALSLNPNRADIHLEVAKISHKRAEIYRNSGQKEEEKKYLDKSIKHYEQVTNLQPTAQRWYNLGLLYEQYGESRAIKSVRAYDQAIQLDPGYALAYYRRGTFMLNYKIGPAQVLMYKPEVAVEDLKKAIELDPKLADAHVALGMAYYQMDLVDQATAEFEKAVEIDPGNTRARILLSQDYAAVDDYQKVIQHLTKAAEADSNNAEVLKNLGAMLLKHGTENDVPKAREVLEKAVKLLPNDAEVNMNYGYTLYLGTMFSTAIEHLKKALEVQPNYPEANYNIALAYSRTGDYQKAREHWENVVKQAPQSPLAAKASEFLENMKKSGN